MLLRIVMLQDIDPSRQSQSLGECLGVLTHDEDVIRLATKAYRVA
jgi:hypothetical protein